MKSKKTLAIALAFAMFVSMFAVQVTPADAAYVTVPETKQYLVEKDTYVLNSQPNSQFNWVSYLRAGSYNDGQYYWTWLAFNVTEPTLPLVDVNSVSLSLYKISHSWTGSTTPTGKLKILFSENASWNEALTWNTMPADRDEISNAYFDLAKSYNCWVMTDATSSQYLTEYLKDKIKTGIAAQGYYRFSLVLQNETGNNNMDTRMYERREDGDQYRAYLTVEFNVRANVYTGYYTIYPEMDTYVDQKYSNRNFGSSNAMKAAYYYYNATYAFCILLFNLSVIDEDAHLIYATLYLHDISETYTVSQGLYVSSYTSWDEETITWENAPMIFKDRSTGGVTSVGSTRFGSGSERFIHTSSLTLAVDEARETGEICLLLYAATTTESVTYATKEHSNAAKRPYLYVYVWATAQIGEPIPEEEMDFNVSPVLMGGCFVFGLLGMFGAIPLTVYRIKEGDDAIMAVVFGIIVFTVSLAFFLGGAGFFT